jgi:hypothetical protein
VPIRKFSPGRPLPRELQTRGVADLLLMRAIVNFLGGAEYCDAACRRAKRCASSKVECFDRNLELIQSELEALAAWRRFEGPRTPEEEARPVGDRLVD